MSTEPNHIEPMVEPKSDQIVAPSPAQDPDTASVKEALIHLSQQSPSSPPSLSDAPSAEDLVQSITPSTDSFGLLLPEDAQSSVKVKTDLHEMPVHIVEAETHVTTSPTLGEHQAPRLGLDAIGENPQRVSLAPSPSRAESSSDERGSDFDFRDDPETLSASVVTPLPPADLDLITHSPPTTINLDEVPQAHEPSKPPEVSKVSEISRIPEPIRERVESEISPPPRVIESLPHQRKLSEKSCRKLEAFVQSLENARGSQVLIVIKGHPDPDCIGSASALQYCYREFDIQSSILYFDEISHPENRALVKVIEMEMTLYKGDFDFSPYQYLAFVDSQDATINGLEMSELPPILTFVDHHKETGRVQAEFIDIREDFGATSSIFAEYIEYLPELALQKSLATHAYIATALMHGIRTDTDDLMLGYTPDFYAAGYLRQFIDRDLLRMVSKQSVTARTMEIITKGLNNKVIKGTFLLAGVGFVREEDRDGIAQTADFLIRHEGVETAVVFGIVNDKFVDGSLRTSSATVDPDRWLKELFGKDETGRPFGGGRRNKGGFRVPLGLLGRSPNRKALWQLGEQTIRDIIFEKIGEKDKGHESGGNKS